MKNLLLFCGFVLVTSVALMAQAPAAQTPPAPAATPGAKDSWNKGSSYTLNSGAAGGLRGGRGRGAAAAPSPTQESSVRPARPFRRVVVQEARTPRALRHRR